MLAFGPFVLLALTIWISRRRNSGDSDAPSVPRVARMSPTERTDPSLSGTETEILVGFLD